jgi:hypothetical protein
VSLFSNKSALHVEYMSSTDNEDWVAQTPLPDTDSEDITCGIDYKNHEWRIGEPRRLHGVACGPKCIGNVCGWDWRPERFKSTRNYIEIMKKMNE